MVALTGKEITVSGVMNKRLNGILLERRKNLMLMLLNRTEPLIVLLCSNVYLSQAIIIRTILQIEISFVFWEKKEFLDQEAVFWKRFFSAPITGESSAPNWR